MDEPKNLCIDTGTTTHSIECVAQWNFQGLPCPRIVDGERCRKTLGHLGHHRYGPQ